MSETAATMNRALAMHRAGQLAAAEPLYRQILAAEPGHFDACYGLAVALHGQGNLHGAVEYFEQAVRLGPEVADARLDLGAVLSQLGRFDESIASLEAAARLAPSSREVAESLAQAVASREHNRAVELAQQGRFEEAAACCRKATELLPHSAMAHFSLGKVLGRLAKQDEAAASYRRAVELDDRFSAAHRQLGLIAMEQKQFAEAEARFRRTVALHPASAEAHNDLGAAFSQQEKSEEAEVCFRRVLEIDRDHVGANNNLGAMLAKQRKWSAAVGCLERAIELQGDHVDAHFNLGKTYKDQGLVEKAAACYRRAMELDSTRLDAKLDLAFALLTLGQLSEGWRHYEIRWKTDDLKDLVWREPRWTGEELGGRTILLEREQGFGDTLQFVRYAELVKQRGGRVIVECFPAVATLLKTCPGVDDVAIVGEPAPECDRYVGLLTLPGIFDTTLESIPAKVPYLHPERALVEQWSALFAGETGLKVGIAWQGNPVHTSDRKRSFPLALFEPLAGMEGIRLFSLQTRAGREQLAEVAGKWPIVDLGDVLGDFHNTAAIMSHLDLVITCDSAPAHLAGALGLSVWVGLFGAPDWRWMREREDSPWYPTMRLFRQSKPDDWPEVFSRIAGELGKLVRRREDGPG